MTDFVTFNQLGGHFSCPRYAVTAVVGQRVYLGPDFFISVNQTHTEILDLLGWGKHE